MNEHPDPTPAPVARALDDLGGAAVATPVRSAPRLLALVERARRRRQRRRAGAALAALAIVVPAGLGVRAAVDARDRSEVVITDPRMTEPEGSTTTTDPTVLLGPVEAESVEPEVVPLAPGPLAAREAAASVWTGTELLVWGGGAGGQGDGRTFADGAAYDPVRDTWREMAPSPLSARAWAAAVWTGTEMLVWGGSSTAHGSGDLLDGAAYDPAADTWRSIAAAPAGMGRSFASAVWMEGRMVVGGGTEAVTTGTSEDVLVYDPQRDAWVVDSVGSHVVQLVAAGTRVALITWDPAVRTIVAVAWLDPVTGVYEAGPELDVGFPADHVGGVWTGEELVVLARGNDEEGYPVGLTASVAPGEAAWHDRRPVPDDGVTWPLAVGFMGEPALLAWTGTDVVAFAREPSRYDPATGRAVVASINLDRLGEAGCGYDAAHAWTGTEVIWWGGQWCRGSEQGVSEAATGARIAVPAP